MASTLAVEADDTEATEEPVILVTVVLAIVAAETAAETELVF